MDATQFDSLAKRLSQTLDRRTLLASTLALASIAPRSAKAQQACTHKLDCAANEICSGQTTGVCESCNAGSTACPHLFTSECSPPFDNREMCPFWICVDLSTDPYNCGRCGVTCAGNACVDGLCPAERSASPPRTNASGSQSLELAGEDGALHPYQGSIDWSPVLVNLPSGAAWAFFTAQLEVPANNGVRTELSDRQVFAARFDPSTTSWLPGQPLYGNVAFGVTATLDAESRVHVVYSVRESLDGTALSTLMRLALLDDGRWSAPQPVSLAANAGHQLSADLATDTHGHVHITWQDQRNVSPAMRASDPSNADVFASDLGMDGVWSEAVQINQRSSETRNASRPMLAADGDRLVAVWSEYDTHEGLASAVGIMWAWRPLADPLGWSTPQPIFDRGEDLIGGRFLDLATIPTGGVGLVYGRRIDDIGNQLFVQQLATGSTSWSSPVLLAAGDRGSYPRIAFASDGSLYTVYNLGSGITVNVGAFALAPGLTSFGTEVNLTEFELGIQGIASVSVDAADTPWVIYFHQPNGEPVTEARVLANAPLFP